MDDAEFAPCTSPHSIAGLSEGRHRFEVKARDAAGNESAATAVDWTVDLTAPAPPVIDAHPDVTTISDRAHFAFSGAEADVRFTCALDEQAPAPCESPRAYESLDAGAHRFRVTARDAAGNESAPARFEWTVERAEASLGDGAWSWFADPRAVHHQGRTYIGWVARDGDVKVSAYDHATRSRTTALIAPAVEVDDHANPALQVLPDGRLRVYYSPHAASPMSYRTSVRAADVTAWEPARTIPANTPGGYGFTYPNPVRLAREATTYLFWRGGNFNPTFATQPDGTDTWSAPRTLISVPNERPYVKVDSNGEDTIHFGFTNAHPNEAGDVNIYYAAYRDGPAVHGRTGRASGRSARRSRPAQSDTVYDTGRKAWVHDIAQDAQGRPVIVFASFAATSDHRYMYARWTGSAWDVQELTAAGGSISEDGKELFYSGGITLDHEDPSTVYLSRPVNGVHEIETWTTADGGATWTRRAVTEQSTAKNVRPVSPRGLLPFSSDLSVAWMRGAYPSYIDYRTSITTLLLTGGNAPPVADATLAPRSGPAPQEVTFDARASRDEDGTVAAYHWDLGDGTTATGEQIRHRYERPGRYFPALTVTDDHGAADTFIAEVTVDAARAPSVTTGPAGDVETDSAVLNGHAQPVQPAHHVPLRVRLDDQLRQPHRRGRDRRSRRRRAARAGAAHGVDRRRHLPLPPRRRRTPPAPPSARIGCSPPLRPPRAPTAPPSYQTPGLIGYWRLGEHEGVTAIDQTGAFPGSYTAAGVRLGEPGALTADSDTSAWFDGVRGEMTATTHATVELGHARGLVQLAQRHRDHARPQLGVGHRLDPRLRGERRAPRLPTRRCLVRRPRDRRRCPRGLAPHRRHQERHGRGVLRRRRAGATARTPAERQPRRRHGTSCATATPPRSTHRVMPTRSRSTAPRSPRPTSEATTRPGAATSGEWAQALEYRR